MPEIVAPPSHIDCHGRRASPLFRLTHRIIGKQQCSLLDCIAAADVVRFFSTATLIPHISFSTRESHGALGGLHGAHAASASRPCRTCHVHRGGPTPALCTTVACRSRRPFHRKGIHGV